MAPIPCKAGSQPMNTFRAMSGRSSARHSGRQKMTRSLRSTSPLWKRHSRKTLMPVRLKSVSAQHGLTRSISSSSWRKPSTRRTISGAGFRSTTHPIRLSGRSPAKRRSVPVMLPLTLPSERTGQTPTVCWRIRLTSATSVSMTPWRTRTARSGVS